MIATEISGFSSASDMLLALRQRRISARELLDLHLNRIQKYDSALNAIVFLDEPGARRQAEQADERLGAGLAGSLTGLPITVKDAIDVEGLPTTSGSRRREDHRATHDSAIVRRAREAGAVIMGKTNTPLHAGDWQTDNRLFGRTVNPWDRERTPGGSTGGGAAAVAAGLSPLELGSDIGGSIRVPAAFCGIYGHRPSDTAIPRSGHFPGSPLPNPAVILNVLGPLGRDARGLEIVLDTVGGAEVGEDVAWRLELPPARHERLKDFRVAVMPWLEWLPVHPDVRESLESTAEALGRAGATFAWTSPEELGDLWEYHRLYRSLLTVMFSFNMSPSPEEAREQAERSIMGDEELKTATLPLLNSAHRLLEALAQRERYREAYRRFFRQWDILLSPVSIVPPFPHDNRSENERSFTIEGQTVPYHRLNVYPGLATLAGQPATAFPVGVDRDGLPLGAQAIGPYLEDRTPIRFAQLMAKEIGGFRPPPGFA